MNLIDQHGRPTMTYGNLCKLFEEQVRINEELREENRELREWGTEAAWLDLWQRCQDNEAFQNE